MRGTARATIGVVSRSKYVVRAPMTKNDITTQFLFVVTGFQHRIASEDSRAM
jgi:hypothetical protein